MDIIPVIDLMDGQVVHARHGDRHNYRPIQSALCTGSEPLHIIDSLLRLYPFKRLYIADINAIQERGHHADLIKRFRSQYPALEIWMDAGIHQPETASDWHQHGVLCVIGSESLPDMASYQSIRQALGESLVLSLDFSRSKFLGPDKLLQDRSLWPKRVIAMSLDKVGSGNGPDMELLNGLQNATTQIYAAGGIRNVTDLLTLAGCGVAGALIASVLHAGQLTNEQIQNIHLSSARNTTSA
ncbi:MAG: nickel transporter [Betaproteobacteria bacterium HGW-Betaproteobacteria-2]|nr:MAG: nickel transporter [Betaproteobacteria bacterium HGW-Betaproteobacteria-2]